MCNSSFRDASLLTGEFVWNRFCGLILLQRDVTTNHWSHELQEVKAQKEFPGLHAPKKRVVIPKCKCQVPLVESRI